ncbi:MAG: IclR family transcriptional regulator [Burkholderiales bacterium]|nr:IclR family transcriptional regulator [Burkholderiales bacterium]
MRTPVAAAPRRAAKRAAPRAGPQSVGRIVAILEAAAGARAGVPLADLARLARAPKTSLVGLLAGMVAEGCLVRDEAGRYALGPRVHALATRALAGRELPELLRPVLAALSAATGETAVLGALAPDAELAVYLDRVESSSSIRYAVAVGERRDLYCTAMGKALLAHFDPPRLRRYLKQVPRQRYTAATITGAAELAAELERVRRDGIARSDGERVDDASALAAPVVGDAGAVVAAILVAGPTARMRANHARNEAALRAAAAECSRLVGGAVPAAATGAAVPAGTDPGAPARPGRGPAR